MSIDFDAEGLLGQTQGEARKARLELLAHLAADGVSVHELRAAIRANRLALLPVERVLEGSGARYTLEQVAEKAGLDAVFLERQYRANGISVPGAGEAVLTEADMKAAGRLASLRDAGMPDEQIHEMGRVLGMSMATLAAATRRSTIETYVRKGDTEHDLGLRLAEVARVMTPLMSESLEYLYRLHLRDQIRREVVTGDALKHGPSTTGEEVSVCFADLVGFTKLGERVAPEELGEITGRLTALATDVASAPVRLVKMLGDAAMLVASQTEPLLNAAVELVERADDEDGFPQLRAGVASGLALPRAGDWYGHPVNLASRITGVARPGSVLCDEATMEAVEESYAWSFAGARRLKGVGSEVKLFRCRTLQAPQQPHVPQS